jgi:hypothetical protein
MAVSNSNLAVVGVLELVAHDQRPARAQVPTDAWYRTQAQNTGRQVLVAHGSIDLEQLGFGLA